MVDEMLTVGSPFDGATLRFTMCSVPSLESPSVWLRRWIGSRRGARPNSGRRSLAVRNGFRRESGVGLLVLLSNVLLH